MSRRLRRAAKRKGLSEMVGALFIIAILIVAFGFTLTMFNAFKGYQSAVDQRAQLQSQKASEQLSFNSIVFGASTAYTPTNVVLPAGMSSSAGASIYPVANMNFTLNSDGWAFTKHYVLPTELAYLPLTITNNQAAATSAPFQQMVTFDPATYSSYESSDLGNVRFCADSACSTFLNAWLESCSPSCSPTATSATAWVKLTTSIPGHTTQTIYMAFLPTNTEFDGNHWGEAPQLSVTYGQYDNGPGVFTFYDDFAGSSLNPKWQAPIASGGGSVSVSNGATFAVSTGYGYVFLATANTVSYPQVTEMLYDPSGSATAGISPTIGETTGTSVSNWVDLCPGYEYDWTAGSSGSGYLVTTPGCNSRTVASGFTSPSSDSVVGFAWYQTGGERVYINYANVRSATDTHVGIANYYPYVGISNLASGSFTSPWVRARAYPPGGAMPSVAYGSVTALSADIRGMSGSFDPTASEGSNSGPGSVYADFTFNQGLAQPATAIGNWTAQFTLTPSQISALQSGSSTFSLSAGDNLPTAFNANAAVGSPVVTALLLDASSGAAVTVGSPTPSSGGTWTNFHYSLSLSTQHTFFTSHSGGVYDLVLESQISLTGQSSSPAEQRVYFDDVGVALALTTQFSGAICPKFALSQNPSSVQDLTASFATSYTAPTTQTVYFWNFAEGSLDQVSSATVGATATTFSVDLGQLFGQGAVQQFIQPLAGTHNVSPSGCPGSISTTKGTVVMEVYAAAPSSFTGTLSSATVTDYYTDTGHVSLVISNPGTTPLHLVSLWVTGTSGATQFASTLAGASHFEEWIAPGETAGVTVAYSWSPGAYTVELVSDRGSVFTISVTAA